MFSQSRQNPPPPRISRRPKSPHLLGLIMKNMYMGLSVPKWLLIVWPKICTPNAPNLSAQFVCPSPKVLDFNEKRLHWATVVRALKVK